MEKTKVPAILLLYRIADVFLDCLNPADFCNDSEETL